MNLECKQSRNASNLEKADNVETYTKMIKEEKTSVIEKINRIFYK